MKTTLTGKALADIYAIYLCRTLNQQPGKVWAHYEGGGWIVVRGEGLSPHEDLRKQYPNGWSLFHRIKSGKARKELLLALG